MRFSKEKNISKVNDIFFDFFWKILKGHFKFPSKIGGGGEIFFGGNLQM